MFGQNILLSSNIPTIPFYIIQIYLQIARDI